MIRFPKPLTGPSVAPEPLRTCTFMCVNRSVLPLRVTPASFACSELTWLFSELNAAPLASTIVFCPAAHLPVLAGETTGLPTPVEHNLYVPAACAEPAKHKTTAATAASEAKRLIRTLFQPTPWAAIP